MGYPKSRLRHALDVYHRAWQRSTSALRTKERHLRKDYQLRRVKATSNFVQAVSWYEDDSSDEYNPSTAKRRRPAVRKTSKVKRTKYETKPAISTLAPAPYGKSSAAPVTLRLRSNAGRALLRDLANKECSTNYKTTPDSEPDADTKGGVTQGGASCNSNHGQQHGTLLDKTGFEIQDEEADEVGAGTNRSGLRRNTDFLAKIRGCTACKEANKRCSARSNGLPCKRCQTEGVECAEHAPDEPKGSQDVFDIIPANVHQSPYSPAQPSPIQIIRAAAVEIQQAQNVLAGASRDDPIILDSPRSSPELASQNEVFTIQTPWAHPINFKYLETPEQPCHFCHDFRYGIYGYGPISADVFQFPGETELREVGNGHQSRGKAATRMCVNCSLNRLYISRCRVHSMQRFAVRSDQVYYKYISQLIDEWYPRGPALKHGAYYSCSLCCQPAFWRCCADQRIDKYLRKVEDGKGRGCGLILCESCVAQVKVDQGVLKRSTVQKVNGHDTRRADMEFLFAGSLLHQAWA
ncbi:uncharacterized protein Z519_08914 [Cladophialophora bantiana CBS 173.52]|uniref:Zn(2)-C6 fungal-type domain-containing protein n=1 Tax=Cladophialophora bantiana (strain ATCC 10958 / CBS 173.52 / CDC B-1940 / NIH 8579) TaxID=1442370 RepID=A0A0D2HHK9_CLAB1|nr:uncharacterized protein Z519_08914 [Cladophialophora bantiana CBS 173.52]KIW90270.1 hypothetical protein Z519_08914 [Cladophialophora bantiana CBS 173.52]